MVPTAAQISNFFTQADKMGLSDPCIDRLVIDGLAKVNDLSEFNKEDINNLATSTHCNPTDITFGFRSKKKLTVAANIMSYYKLVRRAILAPNMRWDPVGRNFEVIWKAIKEKSEKDEPNIPKITKQMMVMQWRNAFDNHLHSCLGVTKTPLAWIIRPTAAFPVIGPQATGILYSAKHSSIEEELIKCVQQHQPLFFNANETVYEKLEVATGNTQYALEIAPYKRSKDGRGAHRVLISQFA